MTEAQRALVERLTARAAFIMEGPAVIVQLGGQAAAEIISLAERVERLERFAGLVVDLGNILGRVDENGEPDTARIDGVLYQGLVVDILLDLVRSFTDVAEDARQALQGVSKRSNPAVADLAAALCGSLSDRGFTYTFSTDNRGGNRSCYIFITRPVSAKIRVSDHPSDRAEKDVQRSKSLVLDVGVGRHGITADAALAHLAALSPPPAEGPA